MALFLWPLAAIVVVLAMCVWALWLDRTPDEPAPYHDPAKTAGGRAGKSYTGGFQSDVYYSGPDYDPHPEYDAELAAAFDAVRATRPEPDHHTLDEYEAIYASEQGTEIVRENHLP
jgi:hypothetical protein